ncbi:MAG: hypothetical protein VKJ66_06670 [Synechococcus sp.]|nr:hypothetical protein [Synechococcus sp.]
MLYEVQLVHTEPGARVVRISASVDGAVVESALGEGATAEEAEDRARRRLQAALAGPPREPQERTAGGSAPREPVLRRGSSEASTPPAAAPPASPQQEQPQEHPPEAPAELATGVEAEPAPDPEDWSAELAQLDLALERLGWRREQESLYLERAFGHPSRSRLTTYADLVAYLRAVESFSAPCDPASAPLPLRRRDLLSQSDALLTQLGWGAPEGRRFLEENFGRSSRQQLSDEDLLRFNMLLESALLAAGAPGGGG